VTAPPDEATTVPEALASWAATTPEAPALIAPGQAPMTYRGLQDTVECLASALRARGLGRQDGIALLFPEGLDHCLALLAAVATGIAVPLAWPAPAVEYHRILAHPRVRALVVSSAIPAVALDLAASALPVLTLVTERNGGLADARIEGPPVGQPASIVPPRPDDLALILHSSGTTGRPKLVPRLHRGVASTSRAVAATACLTAGDRCLSLARMAYAQGSSPLLPAIYAGASLVATPALDLAAVPAWWRAARPTYVATTPAVLRALANYGDLRSSLRQRPPRCFQSTAGALAADEGDALEAALGAPILNRYGMNEAGVIAGESLHERRRSPGSVGRPRCALRIVAADGTPRADGRVGEIAVRGPRVFPGYLDDPAANAAAFLPGGWFRTGDLGFLDAEGDLHLTGRLGEIINRGGAKIAPADVDAVLLAHPAVADAAAFAIPDPLLGADVAAAVVLKAGRTVAARELRGWLLDRLSGHKAPHRIWFVAELPRTPTGKVRRGELARRWREDDR
jgi:acyl-CoA synthetase (AMP-forming)/AMP-acid ligase II